LGRPRVRRDLHRELLRVRRDDRDRRIAGRVRFLPAVHPGAPLGAPRTRRLRLPHTVPGPLWFVSAAIALAGLAALFFGMSQTWFAVELGPDPAVTSFLIER